jgi:N-acetylglucosamine-6-phosphate deacetylase
MTRTTIVNARLLEGPDLAGLEDVLIGDGRILRISPAGEQPSEGERIDALGAYAAPGYIDLHTHGGEGADVMDADPEGLERIARFHLANGTTSFLATTLTASLPRIQAAIDAVRAYQGRGARIVGVHMEGPFISAANAGAQERHHLRHPDVEGRAFVRANADVVRRITLAPELPGAMELIEECVERGIRASAGHDAAVDDEIAAAMARGPDCVTHIYCCSSSISRRAGPRKHLGLTEIGMADARLSVEVIADGRHIPDALFGLILRAKGRDSVCLVSDSIRVAGLPDGEYHLGDSKTGTLVRKEGDEASVPALSVYAGSVMPLGAMVRRLVSGRVVSLADAVRMATAVPARLSGLADRGCLEEGALADINMLGEGGGIRLTLLGGERT